MKAKNWQEWTQQAAKQALTINDKKTSLIIAREMLIDSSNQINDAQLDSINLLIKSNREFSACITFIKWL